MHAIVLLLIAVMHPARATEVESYVAEAASQGLARDPFWLRLLHYRPDGGERQQSSITNAEFFLAADGRRSPEHELEATLRAFFEPLPADLNQQARCRFPARWNWLRQRLRRGDGLPVVAACPAYEQWQQQARTDSVSLVLATGYLGNPASYYGHLLIKFNSRSHPSDLLDMAVNYGALVPDDENPAVYVIKGIFGGYTGGFSYAEFYQHDHLYGDTELRDLWEYRLNLREQEVAVITAHAWELMRQEFRYYFFRENCAFRMAEVLEVIGDLRLQPAYRPWTIPQSVIRNLAQDRQGAPLIAEVRYHPSQQTRFYQRFRRLTSAERVLAGRVVADPDWLESADFRAAPESQRLAVVDALVDYTEMRRKPDAGADDPLSRQMQKLLAARFDLPPHDPPAYAPPPESPESGRAPGVLRAGGVYNERWHAGTALEFRGAYYDALDAGAAQVAHSGLAMGDLRLNLHASDVHLQKLDFFRVDSVNGLASGLPGDRHGPWRLGIGLAAQDLACRSCTVLRFQAAKGGTWEAVDGVLVGGLLGASLQNDRNGQGLLIPEAIAFVDLLDHYRVRARIEYRYRDSVDGHLDEHHVTAAEARLRLAGNWESRLRYEIDGVRQTSLVLGWYW